MCKRVDVPIEALHRLVTPKGRDTWDAIGRLIVRDRQAEQPQPSVVLTSGGHPYRGGTLVNERQIIVVPDLDAVDLTALTEKKARLTGVDSDYRVWNYYVGISGKPISGRGKRFEWQTWAPGREVDRKEVRKYFVDLGGFYGHAGAFTAWVGEQSPVGWHVTVPEDNGCWRRASRGRLYVPCAFFGDGHRDLRHGRLHGAWLASTVFLGFREL